MDTVIHSQLLLALLLHMLTVISVSMSSACFGIHTKVVGLVWEAISHHV